MNIKAILKKLELNNTGHYDEGFYVINLTDSNEFAKMYTLLDKNATNNENPSVISNTTGNPTKSVYYFELDVDNITYNIFLIADFNNDTYYIKIGEK